MEKLEWLTHFKGQSFQRLDKDTSFPRIYPFNFSRNKFIFSFILIGATNLKECDQCADENNYARCVQEVKYFLNSHDVNWALFLHLLD